tara:strand:+ start:79 stop:216 length:138 start_codon:yes stop_codon:yes gene_type:complete
MTEEVKKTTKRVGATTLMKKTISNLADVVTQLQHDVKKIKTRLGI